MSEFIKIEASLDQYRLTFRSKIIIATAALAGMLEIIDTSIVNVAIPSMMGNLGATQEDISWVVTGYMIANAIILPIAAWLASMIGRRKYYITCILAFIATSVACGFAPNLETLVVFRILQGLAGGALLPTSQALLQEQFPREKAGTASAIYGLSVMMGPALGPTLGGLLTDHLGWRSVFNINLPLGLIAASLAYLFVTNRSPQLTPTGPVHDENDEPEMNAQAKKIDSVGLMLLVIGIGCLQFVLERGQADNWFESTAVTINTILTLMALPLFVWWELRVPYPIIELRLFKRTIIRSGTLMMMSLGFMLFGVIFMMPIFLARVLHLDATDTGLIFMPGSLITGLSMPFIGKLMEKNVEPRLLVMTGVFIILTMLHLMANFSSLSTYSEVFIAMAVRGLAMGFFFVPINGVVLGQFRGQEIGQVAGIMNLSRQIGGSIGIALMNTLLERNQHQNASDLANHVSVFEIGTQLELLKHGITSWSVLPEALLKSFQMRLDQQVYMMSFIQMIWYVTFIFSLSLIPLYWLRSEKK